MKIRAELKATVIVHVPDQLLEEEQRKSLVEAIMASEHQINLLQPFRIWLHSWDGKIEVGG